MPESFDSPVVVKFGQSFLRDQKLPLGAHLSFKGALAFGHSTLNNTPVRWTHVLSLQMSALEHIKCHFKGFQATQQNLMSLGNDVIDDG